MSEIPPEEIPVEDAVAAAVPALPMDSLDGDWMCDIDGARLNVIGRHQVGTTRYEIRECSADPQHVKHQPV